MKLSEEVEAAILESLPKIEDWLANHGLPKETIFDRVNPPEEASAWVRRCDEGAWWWKDEH